MYAKQVSELLRTYLMLHDLMEVAAVTLQVGMSQGESNDEVPLEKVNVHNDWWSHSQVHVPVQLAVVTLHSEVRKVRETRRLFSPEGQGVAYALGSHCGMSVTQRESEGHDCVLITSGMLNICGSYFSISSHCSE